MKIQLSDSAVKQLKKFDKATGARILDFLYNRVALLNDPRTLAKPLAGEGFKGLWRYRVGDYRLICDILDDRLIILAIGHRREVYQKS